MSDQPVIETMSDAEAEAYFKEKLAEAEQKLTNLTNDHGDLAKAELLLDKANAQIKLARKSGAFATAREAFELFLKYDCWMEAVECCEIMFLSGETDAISALIQGAWLAIAFPIDPELSVLMLNHIIDETPDNADGAAVAAVTAHYIVGLRATDKILDNLEFLTTNLIAKVAQRHGGVDSQESLNAWMERLQLTDPTIFLPRMGQVIDAIMGQNQWWFDRDELRQKMPH
ncbi:MAG: hypothetical protein OEZ58_21415 [Gammaproteobacteria bacterium]|nr:hypothetical protein [Gammaproteobacteria bacterium]MDH5731552.1 hypothetical protein [Gammaproteobacteria bacterium]